MFGTCLPLHARCDNGDPSAELRWIKCAWKRNFEDLTGGVLSEVSDTDTGVVDTLVSLGGDDEGEINSGGVEARVLVSEDNTAD